MSSPRIETSKIYPRPEDNPENISPKLRKCSGSPFSIRQKADNGNHFPLASRQDVDKRVHTCQYIQGDGKAQDAEDSSLDLKNAGHTRTIFLDDKGASLMDAFVIYHENDPRPYLGPDHLTTLPTELLIDICCYLDFFTLRISIPSVCIRFRCIANDPAVQSVRYRTVVARDGKPARLHHAIADNIFVLQSNISYWFGVMYPDFVDHSQLPFADDPVVPACNLFVVSISYETPSGVHKGYTVIRSRDTKRVVSMCCFMDKLEYKLGGESWDLPKLPNDSYMVSNVPAFEEVTVESLEGENVDGGWTCHLAVKICAGLYRAS